MKSLRFVINKKRLNDDVYLLNLIKEYHDKYATRIVDKMIVGTPESDEFIILNVVWHDADDDIKPITTTTIACTLDCYDIIPIYFEMNKLKTE